MEGQNILKLKTDAKLRSNDENKKKMAKELYPVEFVDLIQPEKENSSSNDEEALENHRHRFYVKKGLVKSGKKPRKSDKMWLNPIIKDMIINGKEHAVEIEHKEAVQ